MSVRPSLLAALSFARTVALLNVIRAAILGICYQPQFIMVQPLPVIEGFHKLHLMFLAVKDDNVVHGKSYSLRSAVPAVVKECCRKLDFCAVLVPDNFGGRFHAYIPQFLCCFRRFISPPVCLTFPGLHNRVYEQFFGYRLNNAHLPDIKALSGPGCATHVVHR